MIKVKVGIIVVLMGVLMSGCCMKHEWEDATCTEPSFCVKCGKEGEEAEGHSWKEATCIELKTCTECGVTEGEYGEHIGYSPNPCKEPYTCTVCQMCLKIADGHKWEKATCTAPRTCSVCGETYGGLAHQWKEATCMAPKTCEECGATEGELGGHSEFSNNPCVEAYTCETCHEYMREADGHEWIEATCTTPKTCNKCSITEGGIGAHVDSYKGYCAYCNEVVAKDFSQASPGSVIVLGACEQDNYFGNGEEVIEWIVLEEQDDKMLVISKETFRMMPFWYEKKNEEMPWQELTWGTSDVRKWLNDEFFHTSFSEKEKEIILDTTNVIEEFNDTVVDKVFCLSVDEVEQYMAKSYRYASTTEYVRKNTFGKGNFTQYDVETDEDDVEYWLRTSYRTDIFHPYTIYTNGEYSTEWYSGSAFVRPAMWIRTDILVEPETITPDETRETDFAALENADIADIVSLGAYEQDNDFSNGKEQIEWEVIDIEGDIVYLLARNVLDTFVGPKEDWLKDQFYYIAFNEKERSCIKLVNYKSDFSLTGEQYEYYFGEGWEGFSRLPGLTDYYIDRSYLSAAVLTDGYPDFNLDYGFCPWHVYVTNSEGKQMAAYVNENGLVVGYSLDCIGLRPAIRIDLSKVRELTQ